MKLAGLVVLGALLTLSGCATVVNGRTEPLGLSSNPSGAVVTVDNGAMKVITPTTVNLKRKKDHTFVFHKDGYKDASATVTSSTSGWVWGNVLLGGIIGGVVDFTDGAAYKFSKDNLSVDLTPLGPSKTASDTAALEQPASAPAKPSQPAASANPPTSTPSGTVTQSASSVQKTGTQQPGGQAVASQPKKQ